MNVLKSIVLISSLLFFFSCKNDLKEYKLKIDNSLLNTESADTVTILYSIEGHTKAKLATPYFQHIQNNTSPYIEMKKGLRIDFYNEQLETQSTLTANYGKYFEGNSNVLIRDKVVVFNKKREQLETEELIWNEKLQKFYTEKFVKITTPTQIIYGDGLESNQNFSEYKITNIKGMIGVTPKSIPH